jgi:hypothetical protein
MKELKASPMLIAPKHNGETRTPAVVERMRYRPSSVGGSGQGAKRLDIVDGLGDEFFCNV